MGKPIGNPALAQRVLNAFADLDGFTTQDCVDVNVEYIPQCNALKEVLGKGDAGEITFEERERLKQEGFRDSFINALAGDGLYPIRVRGHVLWRGLPQRKYRVELAKISFYRPTVLRPLFENFKKTGSRSKKVDHVTFEAKMTAQDLMRQGVPVLDFLIGELEIPVRDTKGILDKDIRKKLARGEIFDPANRNKVHFVVREAHYNQNIDYRFRLAKLINEIGGLNKAEETRFAKALVKAIVDYDYYFPDAPLLLSQLNPDIVLPLITPLLEKPSGPIEICTTIGKTQFCNYHYPDRGQLMETLIQYPQLSQEVMGELKKIAMGNDPMMPKAMTILQKLDLEEFISLATFWVMDNDHMPDSRLESLRRLLQMQDNERVSGIIDGTLMPWFKKSLQKPEAGFATFFPDALLLLKDKALVFVPDLVRILNDSSIFLAARVSAALTLARLAPDVFKENVATFILFLRRRTQVAQPSDHNRSPYKSSLSFIARHGYVDDMHLIIRALGPYGVELFAQLAQVGDPIIRESAQASLDDFVPGPGLVLPYSLLIDAEDTYNTRLQKVAITNTCKSLRKYWSRLPEEDRKHLIHIVIARLDDPSSGVRNRAMKGLRHVAKWAKAILLNALSFESYLTRRNILKVLVPSLSRKDEDLLVALKRMARDSYTPNRALALSALVIRLGPVDEQNFFYYQQALDEGSVATKKTALEKISQLDNEALIDELLGPIVRAYQTNDLELNTAIGRLLSNWITLYPNHDYRMAVPVLLAELFFDYAYVGLALDQLPEALAEDVKELASSLRQTQPTIQIRALSYLRKIGPGARIALSEISSLRNHDNRLVKEAADKAYAAITAEPTSPKTAQPSKAKKILRRTVRRVAPPSIGQKSVAGLMIDLKSSRPETAIIAVQELASRGKSARSGEVVKALADLMQPGGASNQVQMEAVWALQQLGDAHLDLTIKALSQGVQNNHPEVRANSAYVLGTYGDKAYAAAPSLVRALVDPHPEVFESVSWALSQMEEDAFKALCEAFSDSDVEVAGKALDYTFQKFSDREKEIAVALTSALSHSSAAIRSRVAWDLGGLKIQLGQETLKALVPLLEDTDADVRASSCYAFSEAGRAPSGTTNKIRDLFKYDPDAQVKARAAEALAVLKTDQRRVASLFIDTLKQPNQPPAVRLAVVKSLGDLKQKAILAKDLLVDLVQNSSSPERDEAAYALSQIVARDKADAKITQSLVSVVRQDKQKVSWKIIYALAHFKVKSSDLVAPLVGYLQDKTKDNRARYAAYALANMGELANAALKPLLDVAGDSGYHWQVREAAIHAIGQLGFASAVSKLLEIAGDRNRTLALSARKAIRAIGSRGIAELMEALDHANPLVRQKALVLIREMGQDQSAMLGDYQAKVVSLAKDPSVEVKAEALFTLAVLKPDLRKVLALLKAGLKHSDQNIKIACLQGLAELGEIASEAVEDMVLFLGSESSRLDEEAFNALYKLGHSSAVVVQLGKVLTNSDLSIEIRMRVAQLFGKLGNRSLPAHHDMTTVLYEGSSAGMMFHLLTAFSQYSRSLHGSEKLNVELVLEQDIIPAIREVILYNKNTRLRLKAIEALEKIGLQVAIPILEGALEDPNSKIRQAASKALEKIKR